MTDVQSALAIIDQHTKPVSEFEIIAISGGMGRILAEPVYAANDFPPLDNSAMDGYVFSKKDLDEGQREFDVAFEVRPEDKRLSTLNDGMCAYITTGSTIPSGGDLVIPVELTKKTRDNRIEVLDRPQRNPIRKKGEGYKKGDILLKKGKRISPADIGVLQSNGLIEVPVLVQTRIALQVTGNELDEKRNTNGPVLKNVLDGFDSVIVDEYPVLSDDETDMKKRFEQFIKDDYDLVVTTGGISAGKYDLVIPVLESLGVEFYVRKVKQKPGKPFSCGKIGDTSFVCLPGNPVSAFFCTVFYVNRIIQIRNMQEVAELKAKTTNAYTAKKLDEFAPGKIKYEGSLRQASTPPGIQSHLLHVLSNSDCFVRFEPGRSYREGDEVTIIPF